MRRLLMIAMVSLMAAAAPAFAEHCAVDASFASLVSEDCLGPSVVDFVADARSFDTLASVTSQQPRPHREAGIPAHATPAVPEPDTAVLLLAGVVAVAYWLARHRWNTDAQP